MKKLPREKDELYLALAQPSQKDALYPKLIRATGKLGTIGRRKAGNRQRIYSDRAAQTPFMENNQSSSPSW